MLQLRFVQVFSILLLLLLSLEALPQEAQYDEHFESSAQKYLWGLLPEDDWVWWKAQCYQESRLQEDAVSPAGASGVCQLMQSAAQDAGLSWLDRYNAARNIRAGAYILRRSVKTWWPRPTRLDRLRLGWACYNAGCGHIIKAQSICNGEHLWENISPCLPNVTGRHANETIHYVDVIPRHYERLK